MNCAPTCCRSATSDCSARSLCITTAASGCHPTRFASWRSRGSPIAASRRGICGARSIRYPSNIESSRPVAARTMGAVEATHPYAQLTPDRVLDALGRAGIQGDGRLLALGSYENRVYQAWQDEGPPVVVKFYRPQRWSDDAIGEEHAFVHELAERELPVVAPMTLQGAT